MKLAEEIENIIKKIPLQIIKIPTGETMCGYKICEDYPEMDVKAVSLALEEYIKGRIPKELELSAADATENPSCLIFLKGGSVLVANAHDAEVYNQGIYDIKHNLGLEEK